MRDLNRLRDRAATYGINPCGCELCEETSYPRLEQIRNKVDTAGITYPSDARGGTDAATDIGGARR